MTISCTENALYPLAIAVFRVLTDDALWGETVVFR